jgi:plasmid rolling circle replication initiator protein Rep
MAKAWNLTKQQRDIKPYMVGWARSVEITYNEDLKTFHPHYHCLIAWKNGNNGSLLINKWLQACNKYGLIANIKAQNVTPVQHLKNENGETVEVSQELPKEFTKAILETFKYSIKTSDIETMPLKAFKSLVEQYGGKRLIAYGGIIKDVARSKRALEDNINDDIEIESCKNCGSNELEQLIYKWSFGTKAYERIGTDD